MKRNKRKRQVLQLLKDAWDDEDWGYFIKPIGIACQLGISNNSAYNLLRRLWKQGLVRRKKTDEGLVYWISKKGSERLGYFKRQKFKKKLLFWRH